MAPTYTFTNKTTSVSFTWPSAVTGIERIALSAQGELQRVLSAYFARPISITVVYCRTYWHPAPEAPREPLSLPPPQAIISQASQETPIIQTRQVHLVCSGKIVCTATSTVRITDPTVAHFFLVENYAIGQMFRRIEKLPGFELVSVGIGPYPCEDPDVASWSPASNPDSETEELWRKYKLMAPDFGCEIVEVFPDRDMFISGAAWLDGMSSAPVHLYERLEQYPAGVALMAA
ncbi:hypothetical protein P691DRAFT_731330 [Macrolepiota fuliginosa MF-IS2]|uniref:Uncharacterized protein n=1 Tax=Macrolepiota fuliginosa MF-IS2 TaxID=1400762 RepID=A0A9P6C3I5_9AGAR|nr:hypothetical protein P691DRAFT_731330 [Macrolepiota fuliginosa MF-IS2]